MTYWREGLRWKIVLQIMYYRDESRMAGGGPFFIIGHAWTEDGACKLAAKEADRLSRSEREAAQWNRV